MLDYSGLFVFIIHLPSFQRNPIFGQHHSAELLIAGLVLALRFKVGGGSERLLLTVIYQIGLLVFRLRKLGVSPIFLIINWFDQS
jgi:hypothetical protein